MSNSILPPTLDKFTTFGELLRFLRRRAGLTQLELSIAVGYSSPQISRLEQNLRLPDLPTIEARFLPALCLEDEPKAASRLLELGAAVRLEDAPARGLCPYKGLDYFDEMDANIFVGREAITIKLVDRLLAMAFGEQANMVRLITIVGASGCGKSSLVRAGLVPTLRWNKRCANWHIHVLTPTAHPLENLATVLTSDSGSVASTALLLDDLQQDQRSLVLFIKRQLIKSGASHLLLVIDQFEELFTLCSSDAERSIFIENLLTAALDVDGQVIIVITLRADFYTHCANYLRLRDAIATHQEYIGAMSDEEMRRAIEEPARRGHWQFEPGLVDLILHDVGHEPGALPLLAHALFETWQRRHGRTLTLSGYNSSGGVRGAIAETAEAVFTDQFSHEQQTIARRIFICLTELGDKTATGDTRRQATFKELILNPEDADVTQAILKTLADARLITISENSVQVAHEALIREWPRLQAWLEDNREGLRLHRQLTLATQEWLAAEREPDLLYRGAHLVQAREWAISHMDDMNTEEREFLDSSISSLEREAAEKEAQYRRELETARRLADTEKQRTEEKLQSAQRLRIRSILITVVVTLAIIMTIFAVFAWRQSASHAAINHSLNLAKAAQQANQSGRGDLALALALESVKIKQPPLEALTTLRTVALDSGTRAILSGHNHAVRAVAFSSDNHTAASGSCAEMDAQGFCLAGELILWDLDSQRVLHRWLAHSGWVNAIVFSLDGQTLISGAEDASLIQWNTNGEWVREFVGHTGSINDLAIVADTGSLLSGSADGVLILWDLTTGDILQRYGESLSPIVSIAVAKDSLISVSAHQDGSLVLWSLYKSQPIKIITGWGSDIDSVAISADGSWILLTNRTMADLFLRKIDSQSGNLLNQQLFGCTPGDLALSPDASYALVACQTAIFQVDIQNWNVRRSFSESPDFITDISISQDGRLGLSASSDGSLRLWNLGSQLNYQITQINTEKLNAMDISTDGNYLLLNDAAIIGHEQPALWDISQGRVVRIYIGFYGIISPGAVKISPDDHFVAAAGYQLSAASSNVMLWELENGNVKCLFEGYQAVGRAVAFSPNSLYLLGGFQDEKTKSGQLILWDVQTCQRVRQFDTNQDVTSIAFSADGTRAITGTAYFGRVILWDVATGKEIKRFTYFDNGPVMSVAFGPGESTILGSGLADLYLWDVETGKINRRYTGHKTFPYSVAISSDGQYVISSTLDGDVILWDFLSGEELHRINAHTGVYNVLFGTDGKTVYAASQDGKLIEWHITEKSLPELLEWINSNRYVRELTCEERQQYNVDPLCKP
jgi:WD40 repeat protein/transcriptional regulator with XRE-family HTH domain